MLFSPLLPKEWQPPKVPGAMWITLVILLPAVGAFNWGLIEWFNFHLVNYLVGAWPTIEQIVYVAVGIGGIVYLFIDAALIVALTFTLGKWAK